MKKNLFLGVCLFTFLLCGCSNNENVKINADAWSVENGVSIEKYFDNQVDEFQYIKDLEDFLSYDISLITEDRPYNSDTLVDIKFDKQSSVQWWLYFSKKDISKSYNQEYSDIEFNLKAESLQDSIEPFDVSWCVSFLYNSGELYAKLHDLSVFMWEGNMVAKMYTLLWNTIRDRRIDLEINRGWIIQVNEDVGKKLPYIVSTLKNVVKSEWINEGSPNFLNWIAELIDTINSYVDLWISTNGLSLLTYDVGYFQSDETIQKVFTGRFHSKESEFSLSFTASKNLFKVDLYDITRYDEDALWYKDMDQDFTFSIQEDKKSEYWVKFISTKYRQKIADVTWKIKYWDSVKFSADFELQPLEIIEWQKISWEFKWNIEKRIWEWNWIIPELTWDILILSDLLSSL